MPQFVEPDVVQLGRLQNRLEHLEVEVAATQRLARRGAEHPGDLAKPLIGHPTTVGLQFGHHRFRKVDAAPALVRLGLLNY